MQAEITQLQNQLKSVAIPPCFRAKTGCLSIPRPTGYNNTKSIVSSFTRTGGAIHGRHDRCRLNSIEALRLSKRQRIGILDKDRTVGSATASVATLDISALTDSATDNATLNYVHLDRRFRADATRRPRRAISAPSRIASRMQQDFVSNLMDAVTKGIGQLVDADMNQESTKLQALQVQQQLGVQSLSIANQNSQQILSLFKGG